MRKIIFREAQVQSTWLSGSKSHCSISSREVVLLNDGKKRKHSKIGAIFKSIGIIALKVILSLGAIAEFTLFILELLGW